MTAFDPLYQWLGIPPEEQPPDYYRLLGLRAFESDTDVISNAVDQRSSYIRQYQIGRNADHSQWLLNELAKARLCLLDPEKRAAYDQRLRDGDEAAEESIAEFQPVVPPMFLEARDPAPTPFLVRHIGIIIGLVFALLVVIIVLVSLPSSGDAQTETAKEKQKSDDVLGGEGKSKKTTKSDGKTSTKTGEQRQRPDVKQQASVGKRIDLAKGQKKESTGRKKRESPASVAKKENSKGSGQSSESVSKEEQARQRKLAQLSALPRSPPKRRSLEQTQMAANDWTVIMSDPRQIKEVDSPNIKIEEKDGRVVLSKRRGEISSVHLINKNNLQGDFTVRMVVESPAGGGGGGGGGTAIPYFGFRFVGQTDRPNRTIAQSRTLLTYFANLSASSPQRHVYEVTRRGERFMGFVDGRLMQETSVRSRAPGNVFIHMNDQAECTVVDFRITRPNALKLTRISEQQAARAPSAKESQAMERLKRMAYLEPRRVAPVRIRSRRDAFTAESMKVLADLPSVVHLQLHRIPVKNIEGIDQLTQLRRLYMTEMQITDVDLLPLVDLKELRTLDLSQTQITDASVGIFYQLPNLTVLNLRETKITDEAAEKLAKDMPNCAVLTSSRILLEH